VSRDYEALAASWREQAGRYVSKARRSNNLREIVRIVAMASTLEHAARRLGSATDIDFNNLVRLTNPMRESVAEVSRGGGEP
jgi:hypothetical protein